MVISKYLPSSLDSTTGQPGGGGGGGGDGGGGDGDGDGDGDTVHSHKYCQRAMWERQSGAHVAGVGCMAWGGVGCTAWGAVNGVVVRFQMADGCAEARRRGGYQML